LSSKLSTNLPPNNYLVLRERHYHTMR